MLAPGIASPASSRRLPVLKWLVGAMIVIGVFFRFYHVDHKVLWDDEVVTWLHILGVSEGEVVSAAGEIHHAADLRAVLHPASALRPISSVIAPMRTEDPQHPPVYYLVAHAWVSLFGDSVRTVRTLSAIIGMLAIPCMYWLCMELFGTAAAGRAGAALIATSPVYVLYSQEAREYGLWLVCILVSSAMFIRAFRSRRPLAWGLYSLALALSLYVFPLSAFVGAAHALVALCARTSMRNRIYSVGAMLAAFLLFAPWLLVILMKMSDINASMSSIVDPASSRLHTLWGVASLVRVDVLDLNGAQRLFALVVTIPIVALVIFAICGIRRLELQESRFFVWALMGCAALPLIALDLILGGHRIETIRYFTPLYLAIDLALAALIASKLSGENHRGAQKFWFGIIGLVFVLRIGSCAMSAQATSWWNSYNMRAREVAAQINAAHRPLVVSDDYILWPLLLSEYLDPAIEVALRPRCYQCKLPRGASYSNSDLQHESDDRDVFLLAPSGQLRAAIQSQSALRPGRTTVKCIDVRGSCPGGIRLWN